MNSNKKEKLKEKLIKNLIENFKINNLIELREIEDKFLVIIFESYSFENNKIFKRILKDYYKIYKNSPIILTNEFLKNACDVFGASIFFIKSFSKNIYGKSYINEIEVNKDQIREEVEKELRSLLFNIINLGIIINSKRKIYKIILNTFEKYNFIFISILYLLNMKYSLNFIENILAINNYYNIEACNNLLKIIKKEIKIKDLKYPFENMYIFIDYLISKVDKI